MTKDGPKSQLMQAVYGLGKISQAKCPRPTLIQMGPTVIYIYIYIYINKNPFAHRECAFGKYPLLKMACEIKDVQRSIVAEPVPFLASTAAATAARAHPP
jgi:hypothetical protein